MHKPYANMNREELIDEVMDVTKSTITYDDDWTALEKLLTFVPTEKLRGFLPEEDPAEEKESWQDELVDHIDTATSKIDTSNWKQKEDTYEKWVEQWEKDKKELKRLRPVLLDLITTRKENDNE